MSLKVIENLYRNLPEKYKDKILVTGSNTGYRLELNIDPEDIQVVMNSVKTSGFNHFIAITVIDYIHDGVFELVYLVSSIRENGLLLAVRTRIPRDQPVIDSIAHIYPLAYYQEIEAYEFFGVEFKGHDGLRKWILEDNWEGPPPLRKDVDTRKIILELYYGGKRYERPVQERSLGGASSYRKKP